MQHQKCTDSLFLKSSPCYGNSKSTMLCYAHGETNENKPSYNYDLSFPENTPSLLPLLLLSRFSRVRLCMTPQTAAPVPGILQARTLEWVAISFSHAWKWKVKVKSLSRVRLLATPWTAAYQAPPSMGFSRQEYWSGVPLPSPLLVTANLSGGKKRPTVCL